MKAIGFNRYGTPDVLEVLDAHAPDPGPGEVLVRVRACGLNPVDTKIRRGMLPMPFAFPVVPGYDVSGVVEAVGPEVADFQPGDEVFYSPELLPPGGLAEFHLAHESIVALKPDGIGHAEAASLPLAGMTAWQALFDRGGAQPGEVVLILGGAGGVGSLAVQLASWAGCEVLATAGEANQEFVEDLGAGMVFDYASEKVVEEILEATAGDGADLVVDTVGGAAFAASFDALIPHGRVVSIVPEAFGAGPMAALVPAFFKNAEIHCLFMERSREDLDTLARLVERGFVEPVLDDVVGFDVEPLVKAHHRLEGGHGRGKLVVRVSAG